MYEQRQCKARMASSPSSRRGSLPRERKDSIDNFVLQGMKESLHPKFSMSLCGTHRFMGAKEEGLKGPGMGKSLRMGVSVCVGADVYRLGGQNPEWSALFIGLGLVSSTICPFTGTQCRNKYCLTSYMWLHGY